MVILFLLAIDDGDDLDVTYLTGIYERIRADEFRPDTDHVSQVIKFDQTLVGKKPTLIAPHRRLVCYCRLYEIFDLTKRDKLTAHQREVYLFNDLLVVSGTGLVMCVSRALIVVLRSPNCRARNISSSGKRFVSSAWICICLTHHVSCMSWIHGSRTEKSSMHLCARLSIRSSSCP